MKKLVKTLMFAATLSLGIWTLAVTFTPIASNFSAGDEVSASIFNDLFSAINDNFSAAKTAIDANESAIAAMRSTPAVSAGKVTNQAIPNNTVRVVAWDAESFDIGDFHDNETNNSRLTIPEAGIYQVNALVAWSTNGSGERLMTVIRRRGGTTTTQLTDVRLPGSSLTPQSVSGLLSLQAGDILEVTVFQTSGAELNLVSTSPMQFSAVKVSELP